MQPNRENMTGAQERLKRKAIREWWVKNINESKKKIMKCSIFEVRYG